MNDLEYDLLKTISLVEGGMSLSDIISKFSSYDCSDADLKVFLNDMHSRGILEIHCTEDEDGKKSSLYCLNPKKFKTAVTSDVLRDLLKNNF